MLEPFNMTWQKGSLGVFNICRGFNNLTSDEQAFLVHNQAFLPVAKGGGCDLATDGSETASRWVCIVSNLRR